MIIVMIVVVTTRRGSLSGPRIDIVNPTQFSPTHEDNGSHEGRGPSLHVRPYVYFIVYYYTYIYIYTYKYVYIYIYRERYIL